MVKCVRLGGCALINVNWRGYLYDPHGGAVLAQRSHVVNEPSIYANCGRVSLWAHNEQGIQNMERAVRIPADV